MDMSVFSTSFVNYCPTNLLSGYLSPSLHEYGVTEGEGGLRQIKHLQQSPITGHFLDNDIWHCILRNLIFTLMEGWKG